MIAIILADQRESLVYGLDEQLPMSLFRVVDRPILHHIVDFLIDQGVRQFEFVLGHLPEKIEKYFGDGARWGCSFHYHLLSSTSQPLEVVAAIAAGQTDSVMLARGDRFPQLKIAADLQPTLYLSDQGDWTGWAIMPSDAQKVYASLGQATSGELVKPAACFREIAVERELAVGSAVQLLQSQKDLLRRRFVATSINGVEAEPGIWIARNVSLHPSAELIAPVYIGANCRIKAQARLGPAVVISDGCVIDEQTTVANSWVAPGTYVGQGLELDAVLVDRNRLVNTKMETAFVATDSFLLSGLTRLKKPRRLDRLISVVGAMSLLVLLFPVATLTLVFLILTDQVEFVWQQAVSIPAAPDPRQWNEYRYLRLQLHPRRLPGWWVHFVAELWPGLVSVLRDELSLVGVKPRSRQEIDKLSDDWKSIYLDSKAGLITEALVMFGRDPNEDELFTAEAYYTAIESVSHDLRLLRLYLQRMLIENGRVPMEQQSEEPALGSGLENVPEQ